MISYREGCLCLCELTYCRGTLHTGDSSLRALLHGNAATAMKKKTLSTFNGS